MASFQPESEQCSDKGTSRVLPDTAIKEIYRLKETFPRLNATQIHQKLIADSFIPATVSVDAVQRFVKHNDLKSARNPNVRDGASKAKVERHFRALKEHWYRLHSIPTLSGHKIS